MRRELMIFLLLIIVPLLGRGQENYPSHVGDIAFDKHLDDPDFRVCNEDSVFQYYSFFKGIQYQGEKGRIIEHFNEFYTSKAKAGESGILTIRFIVNCEGKAGRFRVQGMDNEYKPKKFNSDLADGILVRTKELKEWIAGRIDNKTVDYYQYLAFKIKDGRLTDILP